VEFKKERAHFVEGPVEKKKKRKCTLVFTFVRVTVSVAHLVAVELGVGMFGGFLAAGGHGALVAVVGVEVIVYVATEVLRAVEPGAGTDKDAAREPLRAVVAVGCAGVGRDIIVAVGACGWGTDGDGDLRMCPGRSGLGEANDEGEETERFNESHL
jgi:hypothetical protein